MSTTASSIDGQVLLEVAQSLRDWQNQGLLSQRQDSTFDQQDLLKFLGRNLYTVHGETQLLVSNNNGSTRRINKPVQEALFFLANDASAINILTYLDPKDNTPGLSPSDTNAFVKLVKDNTGMLQKTNLQKLLLEITRKNNINIHPAKEQMTPYAPFNEALTTSLTKQQADRHGKVKSYALKIPERIQEVKASSPLLSQPENKDTLDGLENLYRTFLAFAKEGDVSQAAKLLEKITTYEKTLLNLPEDKLFEKQNWLADIFPEVAKQASTQQANNNNWLGGLNFDVNNWGLGNFNAPAATPSPPAASADTERERRLFENHATGEASPGNSTNPPASQQGTAPNTAWPATAAAAASNDAFPWAYLPVLGAATGGTIGVANGLKTVTAKGEGLRPWLAPFLADIFPRGMLGALLGAGIGGLALLMKHLSDGNNR